jgi:hypothetical protein
MSKFIYLYKGPSAEMSADQDAAWGVWMGKIGAAMIDMGAPFGGGTTLVDDGSTAKVSAFTGYSVVEATDLKAAIALTTGNPWFEAKKGNRSIEIFELIAM